MEESKQHVQVPTMNLKEKGLETIDPFVYASIKRFMNNETREAFPSITTLIRVTGMSKPTILKAIDRLEVANYLTVIREFGKSNRYAFNLENHFECYSYDFLDMKELSYIEKAYMVIAQVHMIDKDAKTQTGKVKYDQETFSAILNLSLPTIKKIENHLQELGILGLNRTNQKELMLVNNKYIPSTGLSVYERVYNFPAFCNGVVFTLQEHGERLDNCEQGLTEITSNVYELQLAMQKLQQDNLKMKQELDELKGKKEIIL